MSELVCFFQTTDQVSISLSPFTFLSFLIGSLVKTLKLKWIFFILQFFGRANIEQAN